MSCDPRQTAFSPVQEREIVQIVRRVRACPSFHTASTRTRPSDLHESLTRIHRARPRVAKSSRQASALTHRDVWKRMLFIPSFHNEIGNISGRPIKRATKARVFPLDQRSLRGLPHRKRTGPVPPRDPQWTAASGDRQAPPARTRPDRPPFRRRWQPPRSPE
jgi:hypothetical protein